jgi:hypothetical protein
MCDIRRGVGNGNLFIIFGEPDIDLITLITEKDGKLRVKVNASFGCVPGDAQPGPRAR